MYNAQYSNNPFIDDPSNPSNRYPDINTLERSSSGYASPPPPGGSSFGAGFSGGYAGSPAPGYGQQGYGFQQTLQQQQPQYQQQQQSYGTWPQQAPASPYGAGAGYGGQSPQFTGLPYQGAYGAQQYPQQQQQQYGGYASPSPGPQYGGYQGYGAQQGYGGQPQQSQQPPPFVAEFDPLASSSASSFPSSNPSTASTNNTHPREYIRTHKQELEQWDNVSWKQALNTFDALKAAWESTKTQIELRLRQGGYYLGPVESQRLQGLQKEAEHHIDTITASSLQMQEVLQGYRVSTDLASRNRVRESMNAALQQLPDWPPQNW